MQSLWAKPVVMSSGHVGKELALSAYSYKDEFTFGPIPPLEGL